MSLPGYALSVKIARQLWHGARRAQDLCLMCKIYIANLREAAKKSSFFSGPATKGGWGVKLGQKELYLYFKKNVPMSTKLEGRGKTTKKITFCGFPYEAGPAGAHYLSLSA